MGKVAKEKGTPLKAFVLLLDDILIIGLVIFILWEAEISLVPWVLVGIVAFLGARYWLGYKILTSVFSKAVGVAEDGMIGLTGIAVTPLTPQGTVKVRGELWRATTGDEGIEAGEEIEVQEVHGLKLMVQRKPGPL